MTNQKPRRVRADGCAYTAQTLATELSCSLRHVYNMIESGEIAAFSVGTKRGFRITPDEVERWRESKKVKPTESTISSSEDEKTEKPLPTFAMKAISAGA